MKLSSTMFKAKSLRWQLLFRCFFIFVLLLIIMEVSQHIIMEQYLYKSKEQLLEARVHNVDNKTMESLQAAEDVRNSSTYLISNIIDVNMSIAVIDNNGILLAESSKPPGDDYNKPQEPEKKEAAFSAPHLSAGDYKKLLSQSGNLEGYKLEKDPQGNLEVVIWRKLGRLDSPSGLIQLSTSAESVQSILDKQVYGYIIAAILVLIVGVILGTTVLGYTLKPLKNMADTVEKITVGQLNTRLPVNNGQEEIDKLSASFNEMMKGIEISFEKERYIKEKMRQFIADASHELRTPLTSIHGFVEVLLRGAAKNEKQLDLALNSILTESERLGKLVNDLLMLTKLDQQVPVEMNKEDLKDIIEEIYPQLQILAGDRRIMLKLMEGVEARVNRNQIKQVVFNLVQNAVQHTDEKEGSIEIGLNVIDRPSDSLALLTINDNGTGIPKEDIEEIFDRFFRSETHRSRKHGGYGLGLSIVKSIIEAHRGEIKVSSEVGKGTIFSIYLKVEEQLHRYTG